jgi:hypothetical protein
MSASEIPGRQSAPLFPRGDAGGVRPRPPLFRALGREAPPAQVDIRGVPYRLVEVLKHDSWAATALYENAGDKKICKFNRQQPIWGIPMTWLGNLLGRHETAVLRRLEGLPHVPPWAGAVFVGGARVPGALARNYIPGHPLGHHEWVEDHFFSALERLLAEMRRRNVAYVDMHKRENIIVGDDGRPFLVDFQISVVLPKRWPGNSLPMRASLRLLQRADAYHLLKHYARCRPDLAGFGSQDLAARRPWWIRVHRLAAKPLRSARRRLLVALRIRAGRGYAASEHFPEDVVRSDSRGQKIATQSAEERHSDDEA